MIDWVKGLKLSVTQWLSVTALAVIGSLIVALKLQGSRLHKAQVDLLKSVWLNKEQGINSKVDDAYKAYHMARKDFIDNGGKVE